MSHHTSDDFQLVQYPPHHRSGPPGAVNAKSTAVTVAARAARVAANARRTMISACKDGRKQGGRRGVTGLEESQQKCNRNTSITMVLKLDINKKASILDHVMRWQARTTSREVT